MPPDKTQDVPPEIMAKIFTLTCGEAVLIPPPDHRYPWILGYVSARWRHILWSTPSIWNSIMVGHRDAHITKDPFANIHMEQHSVSDILTYILARVSGPISLSVLDEAHTRTHVMRTVMEHIPRFSSLSIHGLTEDTFFALLQLPPTAFVNLARISLTDIIIYGSPPESYTPPLEKAPRLRSVVLGMFAPTYIPSLLLLPWATMENISVECMPVLPDAVLDVLRASPLLKTCSFLIDNRQPITTPHTPRVNTPALTTLKLKMFTDSAWAGILSPLVTPSLRSLDLTAVQIPGAPLASLVARSRCSVTHLSHIEERGFTLEDADVDLLAHHFPATTHLRLSRTASPSFFAKLRDGSVFPKLVDTRLWVFPNGLGGFLDMLDTFEHMHVNSPQRCFEIMCYGGAEFSTQRNRYLDSYKTYNGIKGLSITIFDVWKRNVIIQPDDDELTL